MLYPLLIAAICSAFCNTASARMVPPWAKDLPNWKHYKLPMHHPTRDLPQQEQSALLDIHESSAKPEEIPHSECPTICIDAINECGMQYRDCLPVCPGEKPAATPPPPCPSATAGVIPAAYLL